MFGLFRRDPLEKLRKEYAQKRVEARDLQRNGNIRAYAEMCAAAEDILHQIEEEEQARKSGADDGPGS